MPFFYPNLQDLSVMRKQGHARSCGFFAPLI